MKQSITKSAISRKSVSERMDLAKKSKDASILMHLANDKSDRVRLMLMMNPHATSEVVALCVNDYCDSVLSAALRHPNISDCDVDKALRSKSDRVRRYVLENPMITEHHLEMAASDKSWNIREAVACHRKSQPHLLMKMLRKDPKNMLYWILKNKNLPADFLDEAASIVDRNDSFCAIAEHENTSTETLSKIWSKLDDDYHRSMVLDNPKIDHSILINACSNLKLKDSIIGNQALTDNFALRMRVIIEIEFHEWLSEKNRDGIEELLASSKMKSMIDALSLTGNT